jgi:voltage-gated potassium channel
VQRPWRYVRSFFGVVDLLSVLPTYLAFFLPAAHALIDVRILRLLRIFRIFKLTDYVAEYQLLGEALAASRRKILVFLSAVLMVVLVLGTLLYVVEGPQHGFTDIPTSVYWAITTITTVGFGDITPQTDIGRFIASVMMLIGWGTLAVPTGIVTAEMTARHQRQPPEPAGRCEECGAGGHAARARFCNMCGASLRIPEKDEVRG